MIISVVGLFFLTPNALSFFIALATYFIIQIQIRLEEDFLQEQHGEKYIHYKTETKRLI
jgi:protein-S-isoprenylcysteine O-methyltransferase Ste14